MAFRRLYEKDFVKSIQPRGPCATVPRTANADAPLGWSAHQVTT